MDIPREHLVDMYETMVKIRRFEERIREIYFEDKLPASILARISLVLASTIA